MTTCDKREYEKALREVTVRVTSSKEAARDFLHKAGIITPTGRLAKPYK